MYMFGFNRTHVILIKDHNLAYARPVALARPPQAPGRAGFPKNRRFFRKRRSKAAGTDFLCKKKVEAKRTLLRRPAVLASAFCKGGGAPGGQIIILYFIELYQIVDKCDYQICYYADNKQVYVPV